MDKKCFRCNKDILKAKDHTLYFIGELPVAQDGPAVCSNCLTKKEKKEKNKRKVSG